MYTELDELTSPGSAHSSAHLIQLGQLPVFMTQLGAAVKERQGRFVLFAHFRPVRLLYDVDCHVFSCKVPVTRERLEQLLVSGAPGGTAIHVAFAKQRLTAPNPQVPTIPACCSQLNKPWPELLCGELLQPTQVQHQQYVMDA